MENIELIEKITRKSEICKIDYMSIINVMLSDELLSKGIIDCIAVVDLLQIMSTYLLQATITDKKEENILRLIEEIKILIEAGLKSVHEGNSIT